MDGSCTGIANTKLGTEAASFINEHALCLVRIQIDRSPAEQHCMQHTLRVIMSLSCYSRIF